MINNQYITRCLLVVLFCLSVTIAPAQWPKSIPIQNGGKITIYQPQPESLEGNKVTGRAAVSVAKTKKDDLVFGAIFFVATISTDKDSRTAILESINVTNAKFPGVEDAAQLQKLADIVQTEVPKWNMEIGLDALVASIRLENNNSGTDQFKNNPPKIIYRNKPTTLVIIDGQPKIQKDKDLDANRVVNTPFLIFQEDKTWNMYTGGIWYKSTSVTDGWTVNNQLSSKVKSINEQIKKQEKEDNGGSELTTKPEVTDILVSTEPAELLQTTGEADYKTVQGSSLLYVSNTKNDIFKDINSQKVYVLLAGRWYSAATIEGPWTYVAADKLPADFAKIPEGSEKDNVLSSVSGTEAAEEAKIDAQIPQTAKVDRKTATIKVEYDGAPEFNSIEGTSLTLAQNSNVTVMKDANGKYYALDNGVWFNSNSASGPWAVADDRPKDVDKIPASSEAYNTKYVYVYDTTPEYVYMGYTPGYMGCYVYGPTIVYGTGYYYNPWYGSMYYPRPVTWGFGFSYNPWCGWSMGFGFSAGFMHVGFSFGGGYGGWFGPPMYRPPYRPYYGGGGYYGHGGHGNVNIGNTININQGGRNNIYNNHKGVSTREVNRNPGGNRGTGAITNNRPNARPAKVDNNVFADRDGSAFQKDNKGEWQQRDNQSKKWENTKQNNNASNLNRDYQSRERGAQRERSFQQSSRPSGSGAGTRGGGGGMRGGGGGGRRR